VFECYFTLRKLGVSLTNYDEDLFNKTPYEMSRAVEAKNLRRFIHRKAGQRKRERKRENKPHSGHKLP